jgi:hypothetical protein
MVRHLKFMTCLKSAFNDSTACTIKKGWNKLPDDRESK